MWAVRSTFNDQNESTLSHYGIKGMKWGVRKEYETSAKKRFGEKTYQKDKSIKTKYGTTTIDVYDKKNFDFFNSFCNDTLAKIGGGRYAPYEEAKRKLDDLPRFNARLSEEQQRQAVNHNAPNLIRSVNCFHCSMAYEMRRRGYNVQAKEIAGGWSAESTHAFKVKDGFDISLSPEKFKGYDKSELAKECYRQLEAQCLSYGNGARGQLGFKYYIADSGHSMNWVVEDGQFKIIDNQSNIQVGYETFLLADVENGINVNRLDNAEVLPGVTDFVEAFEATEEEKAKAAEKKKQPTMDKEKDPRYKKAMEAESAKRKEALRNTNNTKRLRKQLEAGKSSFSKLINKIGKSTSNLVSKGKSISSKAGKATKELVSKGKSFVNDLFGKKL